MSTDRASELADVLRSHQAAAVALESLLKPCGLSIRELSICAPLLTGTATNTSQLSEWADQPFSSTAAAISRLTANGLVAASQHSEDRRVTELVLTPKGAAAAKRGLEAVAEWTGRQPGDQPSTLPKLPGA